LNIEVRKRSSKSEKWVLKKGVEKGVQELELKKGIEKGFKISMYIPCTCPIHKMYMNFRT